MLLFPFLFACEDGSGEKSGGPDDTGEGYGSDTDDTVDDSAPDTGDADSGGDSALPDDSDDSGPVDDSGDSGDSGHAELVVVADSVSEFSDTQGENGWYYGYIEPDFDNSFVEMPLFNTGGPDPGWYAAAGGQYWTFIDAETMHPNGETTTGGRDPVEQWAVRRWVSDVEGEVHLSGRLAKLSIDGESSGVTGYVWVDGETRWAWFIEGWDDVGAELDKTVTVSIGSTVDFVLDPVESNDLSDRSYFYVTITQQ